VVGSFQKKKDVTDFSVFTNLAPRVELLSPSMSSTYVRDNCVNMQGLEGPVALVHMHVLMCTYIHTYIGICMCTYVHNIDT
jgi:hypothetical protein